jgi:dihydroorotate dehydrogenase electron transfer subunit
LTRTPVSLADAAGRGEQVQLLESRQGLPGQRFLTWHAPGLARRVQPGQYVYLLAPARRGLLLPAIPVAGYDRTAGTIVMLLDERSPAGDLTRLRAGDGALVDGPLGRGFEIDARSRHLLVVADGAGLARVRAILDEAVSSGRRMTLLLGARTVADVFPSSLLPDEAEYVVATLDGSLGHRGPVLDLVLEYEAWADQCLAAGSTALLDRLAALARGRDARLGVARLGRRRGRRVEASPGEVRRRSWLQVALQHDVGCALGVCQGCVVSGSDGMVRTCREGPAFGIAELATEEHT